MTFPKGAALEDPSGLFNSSLEGNVRRAIDIHGGDKVDEAALKDLIRAAVALNLKGKSKPRYRTVRGKPKWVATVSAFLTVGSPSREEPTVNHRPIDRGYRFIAGPGHISSHKGRASAPASYDKQFGVEAPSWPPEGARS
jgi:hypothetical protein